MELSLTSTTRGSIFGEAKELGRGFGGLNGGFGFDRRDWGVVYGSSEDMFGKTLNQLDENQKEEVREQSKRIKKELRKFLESRS